ncbi:thiamine transporter 2-like [Branchiostoma floridae]|uniref:Thiamine transporter 2-like n=1 Tax=Branchiostoma floridae TaxID=7739 RepID=A0A9J7KH17_BRAFL|nr:thiamine transporter 2-like [Branchiostoma floridae]
MMAEKTIAATLALLCMYGFFKDMRPAVPFLTPFLRSDLKNYTAEEVDNEIYPLLSYSWMGFLLLVLLISDFVRYKPVLVVGGASYVATSVLWLWGERLEVMQIAQVVYGLATATETVYFSYIYVIVEEDQYKKATGYVRSTTLFGQFLASSISQLVITFDKNDYLLLNYITLGSVSLSFLISIFLPLSKKSLMSQRPLVEHDTTESQTEPCRGYDERGVNMGTPDSYLFDGNQESHRKQVFDTTRNPGTEERCNIESGDHKMAPDIRDTLEDTHCACAKNDDEIVGSARPFTSRFKQFFQDLKTCYSDRKLIVWSLWWALATCGNNLEVTNVQNLWYAIEPASSNGGLYNGIAEALTTLLGALVSFSVGYMKLNWSVFGELTLGVMSAVEAILLVAMATTNNIWVCYGCGILFKTSYYMLITVASFQVARLLSVGRYALVFGCNNLLALVLQAVIVAIVVDRDTLNTGIRAQFLIYGGYFYMLAVIFLFKAVYTLTVNGWSDSWAKRWED